MQFFIHPGIGTETLFAVSDTQGRSVYSVIGDSLSIGSKICVIDHNQQEVARIYSVGVPTVSKYSIFIDNKERARVIQNLTAARHPVKLKGISWRFRGDLLSRSYDIINVDSTVIMTHGCCWNLGKDCFAVDVTNQCDTLLCICIAVILDSTVMTGTAAVLPVG